MNEDFAKCECAACASHIEFPFDAAGLTVNCPHCSQPTILSLPDAAGKEEQSGNLTTEEILAAFTGTIPRTRVSIFYQVGLMMATLVMLLLPVLYVALIFCAGWGVYLYGSHFHFLVESMRGGIRFYLFKWFLYLTPLFAGSTMVFFMIKPLFAGRVKQAEPLALNPAVERTLYAFIAKICALVGAPMPSRIDLDCQLNASASFRRGTLSFLGNDLVLTIGLPLVGALSMRDLAGIIAHEFGHFTQGVGMRLSYLIRCVNSWFARVIYQRDAWDAWLDAMAAESEGIWASLLIACAQFGVWFSRRVLTLLMMLGHSACCFLMRQMEYDADSYEIKLAGSAAFEACSVRFALLSNALARAHMQMRTTWNISKELPDDFPAFLLHHESELPQPLRQKVEDTVGFAKTGLFDSHPSNADRIRKARQAGEPGIFHLEAPARELFANFEVVSRQVTHLHYSDDLGIPMVISKLVPVHAKNGEPEKTAPQETPKARFKVPQHD